MKIKNTLKEKIEAFIKQEHYDTLEYSLVGVYGGPSCTYGHGCSGSCSESCSGTCNDTCSGGCSSGCYGSDKAGW